MSARIVNKPARPAAWDRAPIDGHDELPAMLAQQPKEPLLTPPTLPHVVLAKSAEPVTLTLEISGRIWLSDIKRAVCERFHITPADIESSRKTQRYAYPRQLAMTLSRALTKRSLNEIARRYGGRDHTTVVNACRVVKLRCANSLEWREHYSALAGQLIARSGHSATTDDEVVR